MKSVPFSDFLDFCKKLNLPSWMIDERQKSFERLSSVTLPPFKHGISIRIQPDFDFESVVPHVLSHPSFSVHGEGIEVFTLHNIGLAHAAVFKEFFSSWEDKEDNHLLYHFTEAFANNVLFLRIPKGRVLHTPIEIRYDMKEAPYISSLFVLAEANTQAKILITKTSSALTGFSGEIVRVIAAENSHVDVVSIQNVSHALSLYQKRKAKVYRNATVNWIDVCLGSAYTKADVVTDLLEEGASSTTKVLYLSAGKQKYDIYTASLHTAPNTSSDILTKGVLNDYSKALSRGLVLIARDAHHSNGYEKQDALMLTRTAEADAIPNLEINNNDVKCSHGSTMSKLDEEKLFYLMSRGLSREAATLILVEGYFAPVLALFSDEGLKTKIHHSIVQSLGLNQEDAA